MTKVSKGKLKYSEIFLSLQGEGKFTGVPSVFFRTSFCNLRCWWCDTPYTSWSPENKSITVDEAFNKIVEYGARHTVLTGGEPMLFKDEIGELAEKLRGEHQVMTIETNATIYADLPIDLISMSPKLESSTPFERDPQWAVKHNRERLNYEVMDHFISDCEKTDFQKDYQLKFVVTEMTDLEEIQDILNDLRTYDPLKVLLMPEGRTKAEIEAKEEEMVQLCIAHGFRYSDRLHTRLWGDTRGV